MRIVQRLLVSVASLGVVAVAATALSTLSTPANATIVFNLCPFIELPVQCSNGQVYMNQCFANLDHATGCTPLPPPPIGPEES